MKSFKDKLGTLFLPCFAIIMGVIILMTQEDNPDFIISRYEYIFAGVSLILIGVGLLYMRKSS